MCFQSKHLYFEKEWIRSDLLFSIENIQVDVIKEAYAQGTESEINQETSYHIKPKDVGHNMYILAHQVRILHNTLRKMESCGGTIG